MTIIFPDETLMAIENEEVPWFADFENYLVGGVLQKGLTHTQCSKFFADLKDYFWDEMYLCKMCPDRIIRGCVYGLETRKILDESPWNNRRTLWSFHYREKSL